MNGSTPPRALAFLRGESGFAAVAQTGLATAAVLGINVVTGILSARFLGAEGRAELSALLLGPQLLGFLFTLGLPVSLIVAIKSRPDGQSGLMGAALALSAVTGALGVATGFWLLPALLEQYDPAVTTAARALLVCTFFAVPAAVLFAALQIRNRFSTYNSMRYWQSLLVLAGLVALVVFGVVGSTWWALAYLLPALPFFVWNASWVAREFRPTLVGFRRHCAQLLSYGVRAHAVDAAGALLAQIDKVILIAVLAPSVFGVYVVVFNLSRLITTFATSIVPVLVPRTAGKPVADVVAYTSRSLVATMILSSAALLGFAIFGSLILGLLYGREFAAGHWTLIILSVEAAVASGAVILQQPYMVMNRPGMVAVFQAVGLGLAALSIYVLAGRFGAEGAAVGLLGGTVVRLLLTYHAYRRLLGVSAPRLLPAWSDCVALYSRLRQA